MRASRFALLFLLFFALPMAAQEYVRYLLPVVGNNLGGANGSVWLTEFTVHNPRDTELRIKGPLCIVELFCRLEEVTIPPHISRTVGARPRGDGTQGAFIYVPRDANWPKTPMSLFVRDTSQNAQSLGTEIPIVRDDDFAQLLVLTGVPTNNRYRTTLRIYNFSEAPREVRMRIYTLSGVTPIEERTVQLAGINTLVFDPTPFHPGYAQLDPLTPAVRDASTRVRIEIEDPLRHIVSPPPPPIWALMSVTNNDTQQATTITPHP